MIKMWLTSRLAVAAFSTIQGHLKSYTYTQIATIQYTFCQSREVFSSEVIILGPQMILNMYLFCLGYPSHYVDDQLDHSAVV